MSSRLSLFVKEQRDLMPTPGVADMSNSNYSNNSNFPNSINTTNMDTNSSASASAASSNINSGNNNNMNTNKFTRPHRGFGFYQVTVDRDNHVELVKELNPQLSFRMKRGCPACDAVYAWFANKYDPATVARKLQRQYVPVVAAELIKTAGWWDGHDHATMVTKEGKNRMQVELEIGNISALTAKTVSNTIGYRMTKRFPKKLRSGGKRITSETPKQKKCRMLWQNADWSKQYQPYCIALAKGSGKTFCVVNMLNHNPCAKCTVTCDKFLISQWVDVFLDYPLHKEGHCMRVRIVGSDRMAALVDESKDVIRGEIVIADEAHLYRNVTDAMRPRLRAFQTANLFMPLSASMFCNGEFDGYGVAELMQFSWQVLIDEDIEYQELLAVENKQKKANASVVTTDEEMSNNDNDEDEDDPENPEKHEGKIWINHNGERIFRPSPRFFSRFREQIKGRVLFSDPFRDATARATFREKRLASMVAKGKTVEEITTHQERMERRRKKEHNFPRVHVNEHEVELSWPGAYHYVIHQRRGITIAGHTFALSKSNHYEASSQMILNSYNTDAYSTKRRARRIMGGPSSFHSKQEIEERLAKFEWTDPASHVAAPKIYAMARDTLEEGVFPIMVYSPYLDNGVYAFEKAVREIEDMGLDNAPQVYTRTVVLDGIQVAPTSTNTYDDTGTVPHPNKKKAKIGSTASSATTKKAAVSVLPLPIKERRIGSRPLDSSTDDTPLIIRHWTGNETTDDRANLRREFNSQELDVLCMSRAGRRGVDLPAAKGMKQMGPAENYQEEQQIRGRVVRMNGTYDDVYIDLYLTVFPRHEPTEEEIQELQECWNLEIGCPGVEDVRDEVLPELREMIRGKLTYEQRKHANNLAKQARLEPYILTIECADDDAPMASRVRWNQLTKQPVETRLKTTNRKKIDTTNDASKSNDASTAAVNDKAVSNLSSLLREAALSTSNQSSTVEEEYDDDEEDVLSDEDDEDAQHLVTTDNDNNDDDWEDEDDEDEYLASDNESNDSDAETARRSKSRSTKKKATVSTKKKSLSTTAKIPAASKAHRTASVSTKKIRR